MSENKRKSIVFPFSTNICIYVFCLFFFFLKKKKYFEGGAVNDEESVVVVPRRARHWARE